MMRKPATAPTDDRCLDARAQAAQAFKLGHCAREVVARHAKYARLSRTTFKKSAGERGALACAVQEAGSAHAAVNGMRRVHENLGTGVSRRAHKRAHGKEQGVVWFGVYIMPQWLKVMREGLFPLLDRKWHPEDLPGVLTSPCKHRVLYCILKTCGLCYILPAPGSLTRNRGPLSSSSPPPFGHGAPADQCAAAQFLPMPTSTTNGTVHTARAEHGGKDRRQGEGWEWKRASCNVRMPADRQHKRTCTTGELECGRTGIFHDFLDHFRHRVLVSLAHLKHKLIMHLENHACLHTQPLSVRCRAEHRKATLRLCAASELSA